MSGSRPRAEALGVQFEAENGFAKRLFPSVAPPKGRDGFRSFYMGKKWKNFFMCRIAPAQPVAGARACA